MKINEIITESESYQPPELHTGDKILKGKFKNSPAEIKGFKKDKHNQPVLKTNKGDVQLFKPRVTKLMTEEKGLDKIEVKPSPGKGNGLFATQLIKKGEKFIDSPSIMMSEEDWQKVKNTEPSKLYGFRYYNEHSVPFGPIPFKFNNPKDKKAWAATDICKKHCPNGLSLSGFMFINDDQNDPNAEEDIPDDGSSIGMVALKDIQPGEEILKKYNVQGDWAK